MYELFKQNKILKETYNKYMPLLIRRRIIDNIKNPYSKLELDNRIIFIHVPKVAGNGIIKSLYGKGSSGHNKLIKYKKFDKEKYKSYFKFGFVRNPWDRLVSAYFYLKQGGMERLDYEFSTKYLSKYETFQEFVLDMQNEGIRKKIMAWYHFVPQYEFLCDDYGAVGVDFLGRIENIEEDFNELKRILNKEQASLQKHNKSSHKNYIYYYDSNTRRIVGEIYEKDIEMFKYRFGK